MHLNDTAQTPTHKPEPGRFTEAEALDALPRLSLQEAFPQVCAGCGDCCQNRKDILLSGLDLYRLARHLSLPPRLVADAFCRQENAPESCLPMLRLVPSRRTGHCPFYEAKSCALHGARPLACALYPLGQCIDCGTGAVSYYAQLPLCGSRVASGTQRTVQQYLDESGISSRLGSDVQWAKTCTELSEMLLQAGGTDHPHYATATVRIARALYFDYTPRDEFYPQFCANKEALLKVLPRILAR